MTDVSLEDLPEVTRDELAARAEQAGLGLREYLRSIAAEEPLLPPFPQVLQTTRDLVEARGRRHGARRCSTLCERFGSRASRRHLRARRGTAPRSAGRDAPGAAVRGWTPPRALAAGGARARQRRQEARSRGHARARSKSCGKLCERANSSATTCGSSSRRPGVCGMSASFWSPGAAAASSRATSATATTSSRRSGRPGHRRAGSHGVRCDRRPREGRGRRSQTYRQPSSPA